MTATELARIAAVVLSLLFSYVPGLNTTFANLTPIYKRLAMLVLLVLVAAASVAYNCQFASACITANWQPYFDALVAAVIANQAAFLLSPPAASVNSVNKANAK